MGKPNTKRLANELWRIKDNIAEAAGRLHPTDGPWDYDKEFVFRKGHRDDLVCVLLSDKETRKVNGPLLAAAWTMRSAIFTPDANAKAEQARQDFLKTHPELRAIARAIRKARGE